MQASNRGPTGRWKGRVARSVGLLGAILTIVGANAGSALANATITHTLTNADPTQTNRLFRDGIASTCATPKPTPTSFSDGAHHYNVYSFSAAPGSCVDVSLKVPGATMLFVAAYTSYNPADPTANYLGDPGLSANNGGTVSFSFIAPASGTFKLVVTNIDPLPATGAAYTLTVGNAFLGTAADLSLTKTASPTTVQHAQNVTYTLVAHNGGPSTASTPVITDTLPAGQSFVAAGSSPGCAPAGGQVVKCSLGDLASGASTTRTIVARAGTVGTQTNHATVSSATSDPNPANNSASATVTVVPSADLSLTKTSSPSPVIANQQLTYTLTASNAGPDTAVGVKIVDTLPAGTTFQGASPGCTFDPSVGPAGTVTCPVGNIPAGGSATVKIVVLASAGSAHNTAVVTSPTADPDNANNTATNTTTVTPSCTTTLTGNVSHAIIVDAGEFLCLNNATVNGAVIVHAGGALTVTNSTISGSVTSDGAVFMTLCGSTFAGPVDIEGTSLLVRVGDDGSGCAGNQLNGALLVKNNNGGVEVFGNTTNASVTVSGNHGASPLADGAPEIEGNRVAGTLACSGNVPPPTNDGRVNTASAKLDQCVAL